MGEYQAGEPGEGLAMTLSAQILRDPAAGAGSDGEHWAEPFAVQDSSMLGVLAAADALILRPPHAPAAKVGDPVTVTLLDH